MDGAEQFSKFNITSYGGGGSEQTKSIPTRIDLLRHRVIDLMGKMRELSMRPRMPYTQGHSEGQILWLVLDGNIEPDWDDDSLPTTGVTSDTYELITSTYNTTGTSVKKTKTLSKYPYRQPWTMLTSTSSEFVSSGVDLSTTTPTLSNPTTKTATKITIGEAHRGKKYHYETGNWVITSTFTQTDWPDDFDPGTHTIETTFTAPTLTYETTFRYTPGTPTTTSSP